MAKLKDLRDIIAKASIQTVEELFSRPFMTELTFQVVRDMKKRIRLGYGVRGNGQSRERFAALAKSTVSQRKGDLAFFTNKKSGNVFAIEKTKQKGLKSKSALDKKIAKARNRFLSETKPKLSPFTSPKKSNVHFSGQMIKDLTFRYVSKGKTTIDFKTSRSAEVAGFVSKDRPFLFMTDKETTRAIKFIKKRAKNILNRNIKKLTRG